MSVFRSVAVALALGCFMAAAAAQGAEKSGAPDFNGVKFTCRQYTNALAESAESRAQARLAQLWALGFLAGYYKAEGKLELTNDSEGRKIIEQLEQICREAPTNSIFTITAKELAKDVRQLPTVMPADFPAATYSCGQHVDVRVGGEGDAAQADLAELWAFAFIQGYKNVASPGMEIGGEFKEVLVGAINKNCANSRDTRYMDLAALVAEKVKLQ